MTTIIILFPIWLVGVVTGFFWGKRAECNLWIICADHAPNEVDGEMFYVTTEAKRAEGR